MDEFYSLSQLSVAQTIVIIGSPRTSKIIRGFPIVEQDIYILKTDPELWRGDYLNADLYSGMTFSLSLPTSLVRFPNQSNLKTLVSCFN